MSERTVDDVFAPPRAKLDVRGGPDDLWNIPLRDLKKLYLASLNIRALGFLYLVSTMIGLTVVALIGFSLQTNGFKRALELLPIVIFSALALLGAAGFWSSFTRPKWGRPVGSLLCVISLINIPIGTAIGIMGLIAYAQGGRLFGPQRFTHKDVVAVYKQRKEEEG